MLPGSEMRTQLSLLAVLMMIGSMQPAIGQVNMQYSGQYYGRGSSDQTASPNALDRKLDIMGYPVNSGSCGQLHYPSPGTDYVLHDSQGRRCF